MSLFVPGTDRARQREDLPLITPIISTTDDVCFGGLCWGKSSSPMKCPNKEIRLLRNGDRIRFIDSRFERRTCGIQKRKNARRCINYKLFGLMMIYEVEFVD